MLKSRQELVQLLLQGSGSSQSSWYVPMFASMLPRCWVCMLPAQVPDLSAACRDRGIFHADLDVHVIP